MFSTLSKSNEETQFQPILLNSRLSQAGCGKAICLVSDSRAALPINAAQLAEWLVKDGWRVTLLDLTPFSSPEPEPNHLKKNHSGSYGYVKLAGHFQERNWFAPMQALCAYHWLKERPYDVILFQHGFGAGYFCCMAKTLGLAFKSTPLLVLADNPYAFWLEQSHHLPTFDSFRTDSEIDYLERGTIAKADGILTSDKRALDWLQKTGWLSGKSTLSLALLTPKADQTIGEWLAGVRVDTKQKLESSPAISVCVITTGKTKYLTELLISLRDQTAEDFELILMDGSNNPEIDALRLHFAPIFQARFWSWLKHEHADEARLRNDAAHQAKNEYIYFLDEDDVLLPDTIQILQHCVRTSNIDILTSIVGKHANCDNTIAALAQLPARSASALPCSVGWIFYGANLATGLIVNVIGTACSLFKKSAFLALGGFDHNNANIDYGYQLLLRAATCGYQILTSPEVLAHSRRDKIWRMLWNENRYACDVGLLATFAESLPASLRSMVLPFRAFNNLRHSVTRFPNAPQSDAYTNFSIQQLLSPSPLQESIHVALCADDHYLIQACVTIASLLCSAKSRIELYLVAAMHNDNIERIQRVANHFGHHVTVIPSQSALEDNAPSSVMWGKESNATYWRLFLPDYLPDLERVLYLDCDLIVRHDVTDLWRTELGDHFIAAARDPIGHDVVSLAQDCGGDYFNAGVMLINLAQWRKERLGQQALDSARDFAAKNYPHQFHDQSPLNKAIRGRWVVVSPSWNYHEDVNLNPVYFHLDKNELAHIKADPAIYHFRTNKKPWLPDFPQNSLYAREYSVYEKLVRGLLFPKSAA